VALLRTRRPTGGHLDRGSAARLRVAADPDSRSHDPAGHPRRDCWRVWCRRRAPLCELAI